MGSATGTSTRWAHVPLTTGSEAFSQPCRFVEGVGLHHLQADASDGFILVPLSYWAHNAGEYVVFDTHDISAGPICRIELPFMLGWTAHGHWMDFN